MNSRDRDERDYQEAEIDLDTNKHEITEMDVPQESCAKEQSEVNGEKYYRCVDGIYRKNKVIGFCRYHLHIGALTAALIRQHECLQKECPFLEKYEDKPFWKEREKKKNLAKLRRKNKNKPVRSIPILKSALETAEECLKDIPNVKVQRAETLNNGVVFWVYTLEPGYTYKIRHRLMGTMGKRVWVKAIDIPYIQTIEMLGDKFQPRNKKEEKNYRMNMIAKHARDNQPDIAASDVCGCYGCESIIKPDEIKEYVKGIIFTTAKCPKCGRCTVLPEHPDYSLSKQLLNVVHNHFYKPPKKTDEYIGNSITKRLHVRGCRYVSATNSIFFKSLDKAIAEQYEPCKICMSKYE